MYYLLGFIPTAKYKTDFEPKTREENASQNQDDLQNNSQNQDGLKTVNIKHKSKLSRISIKVIYVSNSINEYLSIDYFCRIYSRLNQKDMKQK